jgi:hypothetical protein
MSDAPGRPKALPNFRTARLVGILNVVFGAEILLGGLCMGGYVALLPVLGQVIEQAQKRVEAQAEAAKKADLQALDEEEKQAKTEEQKDEIAARRKEVESRPKASFGSMNWMTMGLTDPTILALLWTELLTGVVLNALLLASGIGLMHWRPWARTLGLWTAALKIVRLVVLYSIIVVVVVPPMSRAIGDMAEEMVAQQQQMIGRKGMTFPPGTFTRIYTVYYSLMGVGMILIGPVYPAVVLWLLTRPGVRSACSGAFLPPREPKQPC